MGMDLTVYRMRQPLSPDQYATAQDARKLLLTDAQVQQLRGRFEQVKPERQQLVDVEKLREACSLDESWALQAWDLENKPGWVEFAKCGTADVTSRHAVDPAAFVLEGSLYEQPMAVEELSYIRKPFRKGSTPPRMEGDVLVLTADNFTGSDLDALATVLGVEAMDNSYALFFAEDRMKLEALREHCFDPELWQRKVLDVLECDCVVVMDW